MTRWAGSLLCLLLATGLRAWALQTRSLWYDEAFTLLFAEKGFHAMLRGTLTPVSGAAADVHPIAYYTAVNGWMRAFGETPFAARLPSVFLGVLTVATAYRIGRALFDRRAAFVAALLLAASPFQVYYGQEARMYAALGFFCALTVLFLVALHQSTAAPTWGILAMGVSAAAALYMHNLAVSFLLVLGLSTLARPRLFVRAASAGLIALVLWLPWLVNLPQQFAKLQQSYWITRPSLLTLLQTALVYHVGEEALARWSDDPAGLPLLGAAMFASLALLVLLGWQLARGRGDTTGRRAAWLAGLAVGTPALLFAVSLRQPVYVQRALLPAAITYALALGWLLTTARIPALVRGTLSALLGLTSVAGLAAHYTFGAFPRPDFPAATAFLEARVVPGDAVLHSNKLTFFPMHFYAPGLPQAFLADPPGSGSDTLALPTQRALGLYAVPEPAAALGGATRVWFVVFERGIAEYQAQGSPTHPHLSWLRGHFRSADHIQFGDLSVYEFVTP